MRDNNPKEISEKILDQAIDEAFKKSNEFVEWFLSKTNFKRERASYFWSRSDNPWGKVPLNIKNPKTGKTEQIKRDSETDVLVVFESSTKKKFALHIENKLSKGHFTQYQPELYSERAKLWLGDKKYCEYTDYETVLIAPINFYKRNFEDAKKFDRFVSHEEISILLPIFKVE